MGKLWNIFRVSHASPSPPPSQEWWEKDPSFCRGTASLSISVSPSLSYEEDAEPSSSWEIPENDEPIPKLKYSRQDLELIRSGIAKCVYCGTKNWTDNFECRSCGAPL